MNHRNPNHTQTSSPINVGIDMAKAKFDATWTGLDRVLTFENNAQGRAQFIAKLATCNLRVMVVESTGGYEKRLMIEAMKAGFPVVRVNPGRVRNYANSEGVLAKTDHIDARIIMQFAASKDLPIRPLPDENALKLQEWVAREAQLTKTIVIEKNRLENFDDPALRQIVQASITQLEEQRQAVAAQIDAIIESSEAWAATAELVQTVSGIGPKNARALVAHMPELGQVSRQAIAALAGVAPYHNDSGKRKGRRRIAGGRAKVRSLLFMAALTASQHNPPIRDLYQRLTAKGKCHKVAMTACIRKLLTIVNAMVRDQKAWNPATNT